MTSMTAPTTIDPAAIASPSVRGWLRLEGAAAFVAGLALYGWLGGPWLLVIPLAAAAGPVRDRLPPWTRLGAFTYNVVHNWAAGLGVLGLGLVLAAAPVTILGAILIAHVGMDRAVGYGLKLPTSFHDTHLGRMGREK